MILVRFLLNIFIIIAVIAGFCHGDNVTNKSNIVFIMADDMGWNDVSFLGSEDIQTPNLDVLANSGVVLHRYYTHAACTPSRAAIMTGKFSLRTGLQGYPLSYAEAFGLPLTEKILPQYFKEQGYSTHLVGKWHLGHATYDYLPTFRGFDTHYGHRGGFLDYYEYTAEETWRSTNQTVSGFALFRNVTPDWDAEGYVTDLYTDEATSIINAHNKDDPLFLMVCHNAPHNGNDAASLQAPPDEVRKLKHITDPGRKIYAAMVKSLDESVGDIVTALNEKGMLHNTLIVFVSDNGGPTIDFKRNWSSNRPLKGIKMTPYEGGIRAPATIWSMDLAKAKKTNLWKGSIHAADWLPTLLGAIGVDLDSNIDGINLWERIVDNQESERNEIVEVDDITGYSSLVYDNYKLVTYVNTTSIIGYYGDEFATTIKGTLPSYTEAILNSKTYRNLVGSNACSEDVDSFNLRNEAKIECGDIVSIDCDPSYGNYCLYDTLNDPCEKEDLSVTMPDVLESLKLKLDAWMASRIPRTFRNIDTNANPKYFNYTWASWKEPIESLEL